MCTMRFLSFFTIATLLVVSRVHSQQIFWGETDETDQIRSSNIDGTNKKYIISTAPNDPAGITWDPVGNKLYWTEGTRIRRANTDGNGKEELVTGESPLADIAIDSAGGKLYWAAGNDFRRSNLNGTDVETLFTAPTAPRWIALDASGGKIYWTAFWYMYRANLDGSNLQVLNESDFWGASGLTLDLSGGKVYFYAGNNDGILRTNLDGTNVETVVLYNFFSLVEKLALDLPAGKIYWTDSSLERIMRANLDGTSVETVVVTDDGSPFTPNRTFPAPLVVIPSTPQYSSLVWVDFGFNGIHSGTESNPYSTLTDALAAVTIGGSVNIKGDVSQTTSDEVLVIDQSVVINAINGPVRVGLSGTRAVNRFSKTGFISRP